MLESSEVSFTITQLEKFIKEYKAKEKEQLISKPVAPSSKPSYVYFAKSHPYIKIGCTTNVQKRIKQLSIGNPQLELIKVIPGDFKKERELHEMFADDRFESEWFWYSDEIESYIKGLE